MANERTQHIDVLELKAALLAIQSFQSRTTRKHVLVQSNDKKASAYIINMGDTKSKKVIDLANQILQCVLKGR